MGCGYLPTGYLPTGYLPIGAAATGGGSLRGKSAAAATLSMATSPAVTIMTIFMMLIPLFWAPGRADRVTPLFRLSVQDARFYHPTFRLNRRGEWLPTICRFGRSNGSNVNGRIRTSATPANCLSFHKAGDRLGQVPAGGVTRRSKPLAKRAPK